MFWFLSNFFINIFEIANVSTHKYFLPFKYYYYIYGCLDIAISIGLYQNLNELLSVDLFLLTDWSYLVEIGTQSLG